jgi:O-antigen/teichoic acid export membrane protein
MLKAAEPRSLGDRAMKAGVWMSAIEIAGKILGLLRSVILARLLAPDDFGLFGITAVVLSMITRFSNVGLEKAIIQKAGDARGYLDTAWTFKVLRALALAAGLAIAAPWIAGFFEAPEAESLVRVLGLGLLLQAMSSPAMPLLTRELEFRRRFVHLLSGVASDLVISVLFAILLRNAWALMLGFLGSMAVQLVVSYMVAPHRPVPRWEHSKLMELGRYGRWVFLNQVLFFLAYRGDNFLVGKVFGAPLLGIYMMAYTISDVVVTHIGTVARSVAFPAFASAQNDLVRVRRAFLTNVEWIFDLAFPSAVVMALCARPLASFILGESWSEVVIVLPFLAMAASVRTLVILGVALFNGLGRPDLTLRMNLAIVAITYGLYAPFISFWGLRGVAVAILAGQLLALPVYARYLRRVAEIGPMEFLRHLGPGFLLGAGVGGAILISRTGPGLRALVVTLAAAGLIYVALALILWRARRTGPVMILQRLRAAYGK